MFQRFVALFVSQHHVAGGHSVLEVDKGLGAVRFVLDLCGVGPKSRPIAGQGDGLTAFTQGSNGAGSGGAGGMPIGKRIALLRTSDSARAGDTSGPREGPAGTDTG